MTVFKFEAGNCDTKSLVEKTESRDAETMEVGTLVVKSLLIIFRHLVYYNYRYTWFLYSVHH